MLNRFLACHQRGKRATLSRVVWCKKFIPFPDLASLWKLANVFQTTIKLRYNEPLYRENSVQRTILFLSSTKVTNRSVWCLNRAPTNSCYSTTTKTLVFSPLVLRFYRGCTILKIHAAIIMVKASREFNANNDSFVTKTIQILSLPLPPVQCCFEPVSDACFYIRGEYMILGRKQC